VYKYKTGMLIVCLLVLVLIFGAACEQQPQDEEETEEQLEEIEEQPEETEATEAKVFRVGHVVSREAPFHVGLEKFNELIEERTDGRYKIEIYPDAQLGDAREMTEGVQVGSLDMAVVASAFVANFAPSLGVLDMPYLFRDNDHVEEVLDGEIGQKLAGDVENQNIKFLGWWEIGWRNMTNSSRPVNSLEDVAGLRIRTMPNPVHESLWRQLGADPVPMAWGDAFTAMQQGAIDGQENPLATIYVTRVFEVNDYVAITEHVYAPAAFVMSMSAWNELSDEDKEIFTEAAQEATVYQREENRQQDIDAIEKLKDEGMEFTEPDRQEFMDAVDEVYERHGEEFLDSIEQIQGVE